MAVRDEQLEMSFPVKRCLGLILRGSYPQMGRSNLLWKLAMDIRGVSASLALQVLSFPLKGLKSLAEI